MLGTRVGIGGAGIRPQKTGPCSALEGRTTQVKRSRRPPESPALNEARGGREGGTNVDTWITPKGRALSP